MKQSTFSLLAAAMVVGIVISSPRSAQNSERGMGMNMPTFAGSDLDGDGAITKDEFTKARSERIA